MPLASFGSLHTPPEILAGLRVVDRDADLIHIGGAEWLLGVRRANPKATAEIERQLKTIVTGKNEVSDVADRARVDMEMAKELQLLQLFASGFRPINIYAVGVDQPFTSMHEIVKDFEERDFNWRVRPDAAFQELQDTVSFDVQDAKRTEKVRDKIVAEAKSYYRYIIRGARSIVVPSFLRG